MIDHHHQHAEMVRDYALRITAPTEEARFLDSWPWMLGLPSEPAPLLRALQLEASRLAELDRQPSFTVIACLSGSPARLLHDLILSLRCQSYPRWELLLMPVGGCHGQQSVARRWAAVDPRVRLLTAERTSSLAVAKQAALLESRGEFIAFVRDDSLLHPCALSVVARHLNHAPELNLVYSNEARLDAAGRCAALIRKPEFDLFTLLRQNYVGNLALFRRDLLEAARRGGTIIRPERDGVEDHDLMLRVALTGRVKAFSVPFFLHYTRVPPNRPLGEGESAAYAGEKTLALLEELLPEVYPGARWIVIPPAPPRGNKHPGIHLRALSGLPRPSLLVMIPFKDHPDLTINCLESIERQSHELDVRVVLIDNRSSDPETRRILEDWLVKPRHNDYRIADHDGPFNFARIHNAAVARFGGDADLLLFLNNDAELVSIDCLQAMAMQLMADESCGVVGIRLMYPDDHHVQHGGVKIWDRVLHVCSFHQVDHARDPGEYVSDERIAFGVTFACAMTRRATFERLGGLEEVLYPNAYGDVALCARAAEAGLKNYYFGTLVGRHFESRSRGRSMEDTEFIALHERYGAVFSHWRLRDLSYAVIPPPPAPAPPPAAAAPAHAEPIVPLRYRVADRVNSALKLALGPAHKVVRSAVIHSGRLVRRARTHAAPAIARAREKDQPRWRHHRPSARGRHQYPAASNSPSAPDPESAVR